MTVLFLYFYIWEHFEGLYDFSRQGKLLGSHYERLAKQNPRFTETSLTIAGWPVFFETVNFLLIFEGR